MLLLPKKYLHSDAYISPGGEYRYWLSRRLGMGERAVLFVGLNPSTADALTDDATIRRCVGFARRWEYDWFYMGNLYAYRSPSPRKLCAVDDPVGPENSEQLKWLTQKADIVVAAWGAHRLDHYVEALANRILALPHVWCLGQNEQGSPRHPLYLPTHTPLVRLR